MALLRESEHCPKVIFTFQTNPSDTRRRKNCDNSREVISKLASKGASA